MIFPILKALITVMILAWIYNKFNVSTYDLLIIWLCIKFRSLMVRFEMKEKYKEKE